MLPPLFNPSNDLALATGKANYIAPRLVAWMEEDLAPVTRYWDQGPWGWSLDARQRYLRMGIAADQLPSDEWLQRHRQLSSRATDAAYIQRLLAEDWGNRLVGHEMRMADAATLPPAHTPCLIYKAPWSSSGKGNLPARDGLLPDDERRVKNLLQLHGMVLVDHLFENKAVDFAMEFFIETSGQARFLGYSLFQTAERGRYGGQLVASQKEIVRRIGADPGLLVDLVDYHRLALPQLGYTGPLGIDMMRLTDGRLHPCVELNLRRNMGILALTLWEQGGNADRPVTPRGPHGFQMVVQDGWLKIVR